MADMERELAANYVAVRESRGWTWEQMAASFDGRDDFVAAWCRKQDDASARTDAPEVERAVSDAPETRDK
jgi:hypothetical protein